MRSFAKRFEKKYHGKARLVKLNSAAGNPRDKQGAAPTFNQSLRLPMTRQGARQLIAILRGLAASWMWSLTVSKPSVSTASIFSLSMVSSRVNTFR